MLKNRNWSGLINKIQLIQPTLKLPDQKLTLSLIIAIMKAKSYEFQIDLKFQW